MATLTTPTCQIPYPDGDELVSDGDAAFAALALGTEAAMCPMWSVLSPGVFGVNYTPRAGYFAPGYRVFGDGRIQLRGGMTRTGGTIISGETLFTLPTLARPTLAVSVVIAVHRTGATTRAVTGKIDIAATGVTTIHVLDGDGPTSIALDGVSYSTT
jgi:hypothetical protein